MPSDRREQWGNAALAGAGVAVGGAAAVGHGVASGRHARMVVRTRTPELERARNTLEAKRQIKQQAFDGLKVNRAMGGTVPKTKDEMRSFMAPHNRQIHYAESRVKGHESAIEAANAQAKRATKVKRVGSGALGAGASLAVLGAVMAERRRKPKPASDAKPANVSLAQMKRNQLGGSLAKPERKPLKLTYTDKEWKAKERASDAREAEKRRYEVPDKVDSSLYDTPKYKAPKLYEGRDR